MERKGSTATALCHLHGGFFDEDLQLEAELVPQLLVVVLFTAGPHGGHLRDRADVEDYRIMKKMESTDG